MAIRKASASTAKNRGVVAAVGTVANPATGANPIIIDTVSITDSSYNVLDDTALSSGGGYLKITGTGFRPGCTVYVGGTASSSTTYISPTEVRAATPVLTSTTHFITVVNSDNTVGIKLNAIVVSGSPAWSTGATLSGQVDGLSFSIQLTATSDSAITSYSVQAGSSIPPGTTLYSNGLFTGTVSGLSADTTYNFNAVATDTELQDTARTFSVTVVIGDAYFNTVSSQISSDSNTWITDSSSNKIYMTVTGDSRPSAFSPYNTNWSTYFDGSNDDVRFGGNNNLAFGTGDFTIEMFFNSGAIGGGNQASFLYDSRTTSNPEIVPIIAITPSLTVQYGTGAATVITSNSISLRRWYHLVVSRVSGSTRMFLDGAQQGSAVSDTNNYLNNSGRPCIGTQGYGDPFFNFTGYISNLRVLKGTGVTSVTVPTAPLTAITNTQLLAFQDNRIKDNSTNGFAVTKFADFPATSSFGPFTDTDLVTGSGYFDGTGDYLGIANTSVMAFGTGPYSVEFWYWGDGSPLVYQPVVSTGAGGFRIFVGYNSGVSLWNGATPLLNPFGLLKNAWNFIQIVRSSTATNGLTITLNGTTSTGTDATNWGAAAFNIGFESASSYLTGYIADLRISNTARTIAIPTSPSTAIANTQFLTLQNRGDENNRRIIDQSGFRSFITRAGDVHQGSFTPHSPAGWSAYFDGTSGGSGIDYLSVPDNAGLQFSNTTLFTIEAWVYPSEFIQKGIVVKRGASATQEWGLLTSTTGNTMFGGNLANLIGNTLTAGTWNHIAATSDGTTVSLYRNGVREATAAATTLGIISSTNAVLIGAQTTSTNPFTGYISNVRVIKGVQLYSGATYTVPTTSLTATAETQLLTLQDNRFKDNSTNAQIITKAGDARIHPISPFRSSVQYSPITHGGSAYFDGTGDYLIYNSPVGMTLGTADFIIECWVYGLNTSAWWCLDCRPGADGAYPLLYHDGTSFVFYVSTAARITSTAINIYGQWNHVVVSRVSGNTRMFVNGVVQSTVWADSTSYLNPGTTRPWIGLNGLNGLSPSKGYISGVRVVKDQGVTSVTVPTSIPTVTGNTVLHCTFNSGGIIDATTRNNIGGATYTRGALSKFGAGSMYFTGAYQYLYIGDGAVPLLPVVGDYTVECWVYCTASDTTLMCINTTTAVYAAVRLQFNSNGSTTLLVSTTSPNVINQASAAGTFAFNTWQHIAVVRYGGTHSVYVNGTSVISNTTIGATTSVQGGVESVLGCIDNRTNSDFASFYGGYIDDFRTSRFARYTGNFTPPSASYYLK